MKPAIFLAAWLALVGRADAQSLLLDTAPAPTGSLANICNGGVTVALEVNRPTTIGRIKQHVETTAATSARFAIWSNNVLVFTSPPVAVGAGVTIVESPDFVFQLGTTNRYHVGALVAGCADFPTDTTASTANAVTSFVQNGLPTNFSSPTGPNQSGTRDPRVLVFTPSIDLDGDGFANVADNCPFDYQSDQADLDGDGLGDACDTMNGLDLDNDMVQNTLDNCPFKPNTNQADADGDGIGDVCDPQQNGVDTDIDNDGVMNVDDNCPFDVNSAQLDKDSDGLGDVCDPADNRDLDSDGASNLADNCPFDPNADQADRDGDGLGDACDDTNGLDLDEDGIENLQDNCPFVPNANQLDDDDDGFGDVCDQTTDDTGCCETSGDPASLLLGLAVLVALRRRRATRSPAA